MVAQHFIFKRKTPLFRSKLGYVFWAKPCFFLVQIKIVSVDPKAVKIRETKQPALAICVPAKNILTQVYTK